MRRARRRGLRRAVGRGSRLCRCRRPFGGAHRGATHSARDVLAHGHRRRLATGAAVLVTSRAYDEYVAFFGLQPDALVGKRVLDCSAGASSFVARLRRQGVEAVAADPAYDMARDRLADIAAVGLRDGNAITEQFPDRFTWRWYGSVEAREKMRSHALAEFLIDLAEHAERYVPASLPTLPFEDHSFDL